MGKKDAVAHWADLRAALLPGLLAGLLVVIMSVSFAALIFAGELAAFLSQGIALAIACAVVVGLGVTLFSRCQPVIAMADEDTAPIFALLAVSVAAAMPPGSSAGQVYLAVITAIVFSTLLSGTGLALLGLLRFGGFIQFLPHSVMGGYFSAVGWLLLTGGFSVSLSGIDPQWQIADFLGADSLLRWLPAVAVALCLLALRRMISRQLLLPLTVALSIAAWYWINAMIGLSAQAAMDGNFLIGPLQLENNRLLQPLGGLDILELDLTPVWANLGSAASILLISIMSLMLTINGLGYLNRTDPDMNRELVVAGLANMASGVAGGMTGVPSYSLSSLAVESGATRHRWTGLLAVIVCLLLYLYGMQTLAFTPRFVLGGILMYLGLSLLLEWLLKGWQKFPPLEYLVIPIILLVSIFAGFLQGILLGMVSAIILFVVKYSRTSAIRYIGSGAEFMSNVDRNADEQEFLRESGRKLMIVALQGYLFFGSSGGVYNAICRRLARQDKEGLAFLVLDFSRVSGLDASAVINFQKITRLAVSGNFDLLLATPDPGMLERIQLDEDQFAMPGTVRVLPDLDHCIEWCEEEMLENRPQARSSIGCFEQITEYLSAAEIDTLLGYLEQREVGTGEVLTRQGEQASELYFLETCAASAYLETSTGDTRRVRRSDRGTVFGELGFYLNISRTASVITDGPGTIYVLTRSALLRMEEENPEVAAGLNRYMAVLLSERLMFTTKTLRAVSV